MKNSFSLLEIILTLIISSIVIIYSTLFTKELFFENRINQQLEIQKIDLLSTKIFFEKHLKEIEKFNYSNQNLYFENFLLLEDVIKIVAKNMRCENIDELISKVKSNVLKSFENKLEEELTQRVIHIIKDNFEKKLNPKVKTFDIFFTEIQNYWSIQDFNKIYQDLKAEYQNIIDTKDYNRVLEIFNNKGLLYESKVIEECGINTKNNAYLKFVISILKENNDDSQIIRNAIESMIIK